jgi:hypothetical protein
MTQILGGYRASLAGLAVMKANTYASRGKDHDLKDFGFLLRLMEQSGETFKVLQMKISRILKRQPDMLVEIWRVCCRCCSERTEEESLN